MNNNASDTPMQFALRETIDLVKKPIFLIWLCVVIIILTIAGPFGTYDHFNALERIAYWGICAPLTFLIANLVATFVAVTSLRNGLDFWISYILAGIVAGLPVGAFVWSFGIVLDPSRGFELSHLLGTTFSTTLITLPITILYGYYGRKDISKELGKDSGSAQQNAQGELDTGIENFFSRLPKHLGRDLIYLNAQDHYIKVVTSLGSELVLLRLTDATSELANYSGFRTHRSWWVAKNHIKGSSIENSRRTLLLSNGEQAPVSRNYWKEIASEIK